MITVLETWLLKPGLESRALEILREMEDLLGPPAHAHTGWRAHANYLQDADEPARLIVLYPWQSRELLDDLLASEREAVRGLEERYCARPREVHCCHELPVDPEPEERQPRAAQNT